MRVSQRNVGCRLRAQAGRQALRSEDTKRRWGWGVQWQGREGGRAGGRKMKKKMKKKKNADAHHPTARFTPLILILLLELRRKPFALCAVHCLVCTPGAERFHPLLAAGSWHWHEDRARLFCARPALVLRCCLCCLGFRLARCRHWRRFVFLGRRSCQRRCRGGGSGGGGGGSGGGRGGGGGWGGGGGGTGERQSSLFFDSICR